MRFDIASRAGRWSAGHWKTAVSAWLAFCVAAVALGAVAGTKMLKDSDTAAGGSRKAEQILNRADFPNRANESVLVESKTQTLSDTGVPCRGRRRRAHRLESGPRSQNVRSPFAPGNAGQVSETATRRSCSSR